MSQAFRDRDAALAELAEAQAKHRALVARLLEMASDWDDGDPYTDSTDELAAKEGCATQVQTLLWETEAWLTCEREDCDALISRWENADTPIESDGSLGLGSGVVGFAPMPVKSWCAADHRQVKS